MQAIQAHQLQHWIPWVSGIERADGSGHVRPVGVGLREFGEQFLGKKVHGRAQVEGEIVVFVFQLAGNLDEAVVRVQEHLAFHAVELQMSGQCDSELALGEIDEHIVEAQNR